MPPVKPPPDIVARALEIARPPADQGAEDFVNGRDVFRIGMGCWRPGADDWERALCSGLHREYAARGKFRDRRGKWERAQRKARHLADQREREQRRLLEREAREQRRLLEREAMIREMAR